MFTIHLFQLLVYQRTHCIDLFCNIGHLHTTTAFFAQNKFAVGSTTVQRSYYKIPRQAGITQLVQWPGYMLDDPWSALGQGEVIFFSCKMSKPATGPTQTLIQWVSALFPWWRSHSGSWPHLYLVSRFRINGVVLHSPSMPSWCRQGQA